MAGLPGGGEYDPNYGIPRELGMVTASAPPIIVNGVWLPSWTPAQLWSDPD